MNCPAVRLVGALLALLGLAVVLVVTVAGLVGLLLALVFTEPWSSGRLIAATCTTAGLALLVLARVLDPQAVRRALARGGAVSARLSVTVASRGRQ